MSSRTLDDVAPACAPRRPANVGGNPKRRIGLQVKEDSVSHHGPGSRQELCSVMFTTFESGPRAIYGEWGGWLVFIRFGPVIGLHFFAHIPDFVTVSSQRRPSVIVWKCLFPLKAFSC